MHLRGDFMCSPKIKHVQNDKNINKPTKSVLPFLISVDSISCLVFLCLNFIIYMIGFKIIIATHILISTFKYNILSIVTSIKQVSYKYELLDHLSLSPPASGQTSSSLSLPNFVDEKTRKT
jgi:hypothetical protein